MSELKACPFCGDETPRINTKNNSVECPSCGGMMVYYHNLPVTEEWNMRIDDKRINELRASYEEYSDRVAFLVEDNQKVRTELELARESHPRAMKLIEKGEYFLVVAEHESYFQKTYWSIREEEIKNGTWTEVDETIYQYHMYGIPLPQPPQGGE